MNHSSRECQVQRKYLVHHTISSLWTEPSEGLLLLNRAAFPRIRHTESFWNSLEMVVPSSSPVCLAKALPSLFTSATALGCQAPRLSTASGRKVMPWRWHGSQDLSNFHSHVQGRISPIGPARDEDISWPPPFPWQQKATLFGWSQRSSCCCAVKEVSVWFIQIRHLCSRYNLLDPLQVLAAPPHQDLVVPAPPGSLQGSGPVEVSCLKNHRQ